MLGRGQRRAAARARTLSLASCGLQEVVIVIGHLGEVIRARIGERFADLNVRYVIAPTTTPPTTFAPSGTPATTSTKTSCCLRRT